jgi:hypothetical protein
MKMCLGTLMKKQQKNSIINASEISRLTKLPEVLIAYCTKRIASLNTKTNAKNATTPSQVEKLNSDG